MLRDGRTNLIQRSSKTVFAILIMWTGMYECLNIAEDQYPAGLLFDEQNLTLSHIQHMLIENSPKVTKILI
jgi:hypothetical protein